MARTRQERINLQCRRALYKLGYIETARSKGQPVTQLAEAECSSLYWLEHNTRCFVCGTQQEAPESVRLWEQDRLGRECRQRYAGMTWQEALIAHRARKRVTV